MIICAASNNQGKLKELRRILEDHDIQQMTVEEMQEQDKKLEALRKKMHDINAANERLSQRYGGDEKYMRIHKSLLRKELIKNQTVLFNFLVDMKQRIDDQLFHKESILENENFFEKNLWKDIKLGLKDIPGQELTLDIVKQIGHEIKEQYIQ